MDTLMTVLTVAGCTFLICVPGNDDVMLSYQSLSYHDALALRAMTGVRAAPEFEEWLGQMDMLRPDGSIRALGDGAAGLVHRLIGSVLAA